MFEKSLSRYDNTFSDQMRKTTTYYKVTHLLNQVRDNFQENQESSLTDNIYFEDKNMCKQNICIQK